jgi:hypothetical protein
MPDEASTDNRGQVHFVGETVTMLCIGQDIDRQGSPAPCLHRDDPLVPERTNQAIERHRREMTDHRTQR